MNLALAEEGWRGRYLAQLANYTYHLHSTAHDIAGLRARLHDLGLALEVHGGNPFYDAQSGHHGFVAIGSEYTVIAIRGSGEVDDWRNNLRIRQQPYWLGGRVHRGYALAARGISEAVQAELQSHLERYEGKHIWLTGHSSGGAVALLVAQELSAAAVDIAGVYTFGAPKVGDAEHAHTYSLRDKLHVFATLGDVTPWLPPDWVMRTEHQFCIQRYVHVVRPKLLVGKTISAHAAWDKLSNKSISLSERIIGACIEFSPHSLNAYIANLK